MLNKISLQKYKRFFIEHKLKEILITSTSLQGTVCITYYNYSKSFHSKEMQTNHVEKSMNELLNDFSF